MKERCIPCENKKRVNNELYEIRKQRAIQWGRAQGLEMVALIAPEEDGLPTFCKEADVAGRRVAEWLWCGA